MTTRFERLLATNIPPQAGTLGNFILGTDVLGPHSGLSFEADASTFEWYVRVIKPSGSAVLGNFILGTDVLTPLGWSDITPDCHGIHVDRGGAPSVNIGAGEMRFAIDNETDAYSPWRSIYWGPGTVVQTGFYVGVARTAIPLCTGIVAEWNERTEGIDARRWIDVSALETISILGENDEASISLTGAGEAVAARVARILTAARWQFGSFIKVPGPNGSWSFQATDLSPDSWTEIQTVAQSLAVVSKPSRTGKIVIAERDAGVITGYETAGVDFPIVGDSIVTANDDRILVGSVPVARVGGSVVTYQSDVSVSRYQRRSLPFSGMTTLDPGGNADLVHYADDRLDRGKLTYRVQMFSLDSSNGDSVLQFAARVDLGTRLDVDKPNSDGTGVLFSGFLVCGYTIDIEPLQDLDFVLRMTVQTEPSSTATWAHYGDDTPAFCTPGVMGGTWDPTSGGDHRFTYDAGGGFYYIDDASQQVCSIWPDAWSGAQSIEVTFSNFGTNNADGLDGGGNPNICNDYIGIECRRGGSLFLGDGLGIYFHRYTDSPTGGFDPDTWQWWVDCEVANSSIYFDSSSPTWAPWPYGETFTLRLESDTNGDYRVYVDDVLLTSGNVPGQPGGPTKFSIYCESDNGNTGDPDRVPHFSAICLHGET